MNDKPTSRDVFVQSVRDHLDGTPNANHPVQFEQFSDTMVCCTFCSVAVPETHQNEHRAWHNAHNRVHDQIMQQAHRHVPEPRYGGR